MFRKNNIVLTLTAFLALLLLGMGLYREKTLNKLAPVSLQAGRKLTTGEEDRAFMADLLYRIAYPVVHNLAEGTLKK